VGRGVGVVAGPPIRQFAELRRVERERTVERRRVRIDEQLRGGSYGPKARNP
jgi:hypothetical protein